MHKYPVLLLLNGHTWRFFAITYRSQKVDGKINGNEPYFVNGPQPITGEDEGVQTECSQKECDGKRKSNDGGSNPVPKKKDTEQQNHGSDFDNELSASDSEEELYL